MHPKVSLLAEMGELPVLWEARVRCVLIWYKVLCSKVYKGFKTLEEGAGEAVRFGKGHRIQKMMKCMCGRVWVAGCERR